MPATPDPLPVRTHSSPPAFVCSWTSRGLDAAWIHMTGELDIATTPQLERTLREPPGKSRLVVLDLRDLGFMDVAGVHTIVEASLRARAGGGRLVLLRGPPSVDRIFTLTSACDEVEISDVDALAPPDASRR